MDPFIPLTDPGPAVQKREKKVINTSFGPLYVTTDSSLSQREKFFISLSHGPKLGHVPASQSQGGHLYTV